jgi:hypothetical protein
LADRSFVLPIHLLAEILIVLDGEMAHKLREHVVTHHAFDPGIGAPEWLPFAEQRIPDATLVRMIEALETDPEADVRSVAEQFGYPTSLVECHLADYRRRFERALRDLAGRRS